MALASLFGIYVALEKYWATCGILRAWREFCSCWRSGFRCWRQATPASPRTSSCIGPAVEAPPSLFTYVLVFSYQWGLRAYIHAAASR